MKKKMFAACMMRALMLTMMAGGASEQSEQVGTEVEVDREIDISFDTCEILKPSKTSSPYLCGCMSPLNSQVANTWESLLI